MDRFGFCHDDFWSPRFFSDKPPVLSQCFEDTMLTYLSSLCAYFCLFHAFSAGDAKEDRIATSKCIVKTIVAQMLAVVYSYGLLMAFDSEDSSLSFAVSMLLKTTNFIVLIVAQRRLRPGSLCVTVFWYVSLLCETPSVYRILLETFQKTNMDERRVLQSTTVYMLLALQCFMEIPNLRNSLDSSRKKFKLSSAKETSFLSRTLFFSHLSSLISTGNRRPLVEEDLPAPLPELESERWHSKWENVVRQQQAQGKAFSLFRSLWKAFWIDIVAVWVLGVTFITLGSSPFLLLNNIVIFFDSADDPAWKGYAYVVAISVVNMVTYAIFRFNECRLTSLGLRLKAVLVGAITRKAFDINPTNLGKYANGELVNLVSVDCDKVNRFAAVLGMTVACPFYVVFCTGVLWAYIGPSSVIGLAVVLLTTPLTNWVASFYRKIQIEQMLMKDQRLKLISELLTSIKIVKFHGWEPAFMRKIAKVRKIETKFLMKFAWFTASLRFFWSLSPTLITLAAFLSYLLLNDLTAFSPNVVFVSLFLLNSMRFSLFMIPDIVANAMQTLVSLRRIEEFLKADELDKDSIGNQPSPGAAITWSSATLSWNSPTESVLKNISLSVKPGELLAVVGPVGSGKSSLLTSLLHELKVVTGTVDLRGTVAFVPQQAWIQNATVKQNITFTRPFLENEFNAVATACCLVEDLAILPGAEETEIGERGINLSGGQKQRVSLARAVYQNRDIYLLDDPLSAVDAHVGAAIFKNVIGHCGVLKNKTRIFVTNHLSILPEVDRIAVLKNGRIVELGTYDQLKQSNGEFAELLSEHTRDQTQENKDAELNGGATKSKPLAEDCERSTGQNCGLVTDEMTRSGSVRLQIYKRFISKMGVDLFFWTFAGFGLSRVCHILSGVWLSLWSQDEAGHSKAHYDMRTYRFTVFAVLSLFYTALQFLGAASISIGAVRAAGKLHRNMLSALVKAPMSFFETTPVGRILNRFGRDVDHVEIQLPTTFHVFMEMTCQTIAVILLVAVVVPIFLLFLVPLLIVYLILQRIYMKSARQLKRIEAVSRSPVTNYFSEILSGLTSIRAYGAVPDFVRKSNANVDNSHNNSYLLTLARLWLGVRVDLNSNVMLFIANTLLVTQKGKMDAGLVGLIIASLLGILYSINHIVHYASEVESCILASERIEEYCDVKPEAAWVAELRPSPQWPERGSVVFEDFSTRYRDGLDLVLKRINLRIEPGEKIGIVGRTGAGKSSLTLSLFRIIEAVGGRLQIDGIDVSQIGVHDLRPRLTIIPQDPVIFSGTLRSNLDPKRQHSDEQLWNALEKAHVKEHFAADGLEREIAEGGTNLSMGQRQLLCLARAVLQKGRVLILDEATAAVDVETDALIQQTIRSDFSDCTVITIAHRLNTILDSDRIIVMGQGEILEQGQPAKLLSDSNSHFYGLAREAGLVDR